MNTLKKIAATKSKGPLLSKVKRNLQADKNNSQKKNANRMSGPKGILGNVTKKAIYMDQVMLCDPLNIWV